MTILDQIKAEKIRYDISREAAKTSASASDKIDKYEYVTGEEILPYNQKQIIEQGKFTYSSLGKAFEKQTKTIQDQGEKQVGVLEVLEPNTQKLAIKNMIPELYWVKKLKMNLIKLKNKKKR